MRDIILTAPTEAALISALPQYRIPGDDEIAWAPAVIYGCTRWITRPQYDASGELMNTPSTVPGYHLIIRAESLPAAAQPFIVTNPGDIEPIPAGGLLLPSFPTSITRLQARLALIDAGQWDGIQAWAATQDEYVRAFFEDAPIWFRDNPVLNAGAIVMGLSQTALDELFTKAATI